jgi:hypothetical protein
MSGSPSAQRQGLVAAIYVVSRGTDYQRKYEKNQINVRFSKELSYQQLVSNLSGIRFLLTQLRSTTVAEPNPLEWE